MQRPCTSGNLTKCLNYIHLHLYTELKFLFHGVVTMTRTALFWITAVLWTKHLFYIWRHPDTEISQYWGTIQLASSRRTQHRTYHNRNTRCFKSFHNDQTSSVKIFHLPILDDSKAGKRYNRTCRLLNLVMAGLWLGGKLGLKLCAWLLGSFDCSDWNSNKATEESTLTKLHELVREKWEYHTLLEDETWGKRCYSIVRRYNMLKNNWQSSAWNNQTIQTFIQLYTRVNFSGLLRSQVC